MIGYIQGCDAVSITIVAPFSDTRLIERQNITECEVILHDGRSLSPLQRNKIFALVNDITAFVSGFDKKKFAFNETLCSRKCMTWGRRPLMGSITCNGCGWTTWRAKN